MRFILSYVFIGLLTIAVLTFVITAKVSADLTREISLSTDRAIEQSYNTANILLTFTFENFGTVFNSADIQAGFYNEDFNTSQLGRIGSKLYELTSTNPLIHSIYLLNVQKKLAFSSLTTVRSFDDFYDPGALRLLGQVQPYVSGIFYPRHIDYDIYGKRYAGNLISLVYVSSIGQNTNGAMVLNLNQQMLQSMVMNGAEKGSFQSMILNKQGIVVSHTDSAMINASLADRSFVKQINASRAPRGSLELTMDGRDYRISYIKSDSLGWTFIGIIDYEHLLGKVQGMKRFILSVTGVMLLVILILGGFMTRWIYGPIHRLIQNVRSSSWGAKGRDAASELDLLDGTFSYLETKIQDLQTSVADFQSAKRQEVLRLLTAGGWSNEAEMSRTLAAVGIRFEHEGFVTGVLRLDSYRELLAAYRPADIALFKYAVSNIAVEVVSGKFPAVCFDCGDDGIGLIVNVPGGMTETGAVFGLLEEMQSHVRRFLRLSVTAAVGPPVRHMPAIPSSWEAACGASKYRLVLGTGALIGPDEETARASLQISRVSTLEKTVMDRLKQGDAGKIKEAVSEFIAYVRKAPIGEIMASFTQLLMATARTAKAMTAADQADSRIDIGPLTEQLSRWETIEEIERWYLGLCGEIAELRDREAQHKNKWVVDKIIRHIHDHYSDPNLTMEALVLIGGLSTNYTRKVFKEIAGQSISVYLNEYRFERARELLVTTDLPANKIGEMVGFDNTNYFYVSFKKHFGKTPDHYRKQPDIQPV
nr:AraC family transcriptional regulator [Paenibacillus hamazuiensis]